MTWKLKSSGGLTGDQGGVCQPRQLSMHAVDQRHEPTNSPSHPPCLRARLTDFSHEDHFCHHTTTVVRSMLHSIAIQSNGRKSPRHQCHNVMTRSSSSWRSHRLRQSHRRLVCQATLHLPTSSRKTATPQYTADTSRWVPAISSICKVNSMNWKSSWKR